MQCKTFNPAWFADGSAWSNRNRITFSAVSHLRMERYDAPTYGIKFMTRGAEHYVLNNKRFAVSTGKFLVVNGHQPLDITVHSEKAVGFCIHLQKQLLQEVYASLTRSTGEMLNEPFTLSAFPDFEQLLYSTEENSLGEYLNHIASHFDHSTKGISIPEHELFYNLAQRMLLLQNNLPATAEELNTVRSSTRKELLRRLAIAKELMDEQKNEPLNIEFLSKHAMLSGSHFFRTFKKVYGVSPHQYIFKNRMTHGASLLSQKNTTATQVALECGFADLAAFSKAFKKMYGVSPGNYEM